MDISTNHLGRIELGKGNTAITTLYRMANVLNIPSHFHDEMKQYIPDSDE